MKYTFNMGVKRCVAEKCNFPGYFFLTSVENVTRSRTDV